MHVSWAHVIEFFLDPLCLIFFIFFLSLGFQLVRRRAAGLIFGTIGILFFLIVLIFPVGEWITLPLENLISATPVFPKSVDGIIVLGGSVDPDISYERRQVSLKKSVERLTCLKRLIKTYPEARYVVTGGFSARNHPEYSEADAAKQFLSEMGFNTDAIIFENQSRNTYENVVYSKKLLNIQPGEKWILVTSAAHMPRSMALFKKADWTVIPYPVDYETTGIFSWFSRINLYDNFRKLSSGMHEWGALVLYRLKGYL